MKKKLNDLLDWLSNRLASRKGLLPIIGMALILFNLLLQLFPGLGWVVTSHLFLHLGIIVAIFGIMLAWAL